MLYTRMPIEIESPEEIGYEKIKYNLSESSMMDLNMGDLHLSLDDLKLEYVAHRGHNGLRKLIASESNNINEDHVLLTNGAAGALFIINTSILTPQDHLIIVRPNYATNIEVPKVIGCDISYIDLTFEEEWQLDVQKIKAAIRPNTALISITSPHNPTGILVSELAIDKIITIAEAHNIYVLIDETYRDTCFKTPYPITAAKSLKVISVSSISKAYGLPGLRIGWLITQDNWIMERFLAAKEMIYISNSALDEAVAYQFYVNKKSFAKKHNERAIRNYTLLSLWLSTESRLEAILPQGGVVCFVRFTNETFIDLTIFYDILVNQFLTMVGPGHWFEMSDRYMRIGFGWTDEEIFKQGLTNISMAIDECLNQK
ncbi:MAG: aminotransferase class I/II-fold pyridoxal phosphate-dependent enzyme [Saprospiraceae bacterium]|nr:aminotransferase class I/II-fold pyridoxal phosphate-dependent enzyme [Saprospiraceae bacterium]